MIKKIKMILERVKVRFTIYSKNHSAKAVYGKKYVSSYVDVKFLFDFKKGPRFSTITPNAGFFDRNPFKVIFRVLKINHNFVNRSKSIRICPDRIIKGGI